MKIREKLTLQFTAIVGIILIVFSFSIYFVIKAHRYNSFRDRLLEKALNTANLLLEVDEIDINLLKELRRNYLQSLPEEFVRVYDKNDSRIFKDDSLDYTFSPSILNNVRKDRKLDFSDGDRQFVAISYKKDFVIIASARNIFGAQELKHLALILIIGNFLCLIVILISGRFFARQALKPISKIVTQVESIGEPNLGSRLDEGEKKDEISHLAMTFNKMFERIHDAFERQKRFVANASHELRTPLTTITGEIEVALMKNRTLDQYIQVLNSVLEEAKTLTKLSNDLLKLTQAGDIKGIIIGRISLLELLHVISEENSKRNSDAVINYEISKAVKPDELFISGNVDLLKIALLNVIENGYKFSSYAPIDLIVSSNEEMVFIKVKDSGVGMTEEELGYVFQPFYRSENVSSIEGSGIGLSLTDKIIKLHGGFIEISSEISKGTEVTIALPIDTGTI